MTYDTDPTRWTKTPSAAPELLRDAFDAGHREGPSELQMRSLALKLAALSGGAVLAATAAPAQAATAQAGGAAASSAITTGGGLSFAKVAVSLALLGAAAGTVVYRGVETPATMHHEQPTSALEARTPVVAPVVLPPAKASGGARRVPSAAAESAAEKAAPAAGTIAGDDVGLVQGRDIEPSSEQPVRVMRQVAEAPRSRSVRERRRQRSEQRPRTFAAPSAASAEETRETSGNSNGESASVQEIDLLRSARANLTSRPREAYRLAELHRREFPTGVFVQERDALAIEALLRAGELKEARALAEKFVERYPGSPHAHRFRESMEIP
jgi:hypothetical protein